MNFAFLEIQEKVILYKGSLICALKDALYTLRNKITHSHIHKSAHTGCLKKTQPF